VGADRCRSPRFETAHGVRIAWVVTRADPPHCQPGVLRELTAATMEMVVRGKSTRRARLPGARVRGR